MEKFALLIGVSEYESSLTPLPTAIRDAEALREVLVHPEMGGFPQANVKMLHNPSQLDMAIAIHTLFSTCQKDDLVLFFFSGHGITDDKGRLYLSTQETRNTENGELITPTSVAASFIHEQMSNSRSKRQVVILDSCFSAAFAKGMGGKDNCKVDVQSQLGGKGRAVLTSSDSTQYSLYQADEELSIYTRYLVEGIRTGAADADDDGYISIAELHEYARYKVAGVTSKMTPKIFYVAEEGHWIQIATTLAKASKLKFQRAEAFRNEFNNWLDMVFKYEAEKNINSLIDSVSESLSDGLVQKVFEPCLAKWLGRDIGYFTIPDLESKVVIESAKWIDSDEAKKLVAKEINGWVSRVLGTLTQDLRAISQRYHLEFEEFQDLLSYAGDGDKFGRDDVYSFGKFKSPKFDVFADRLSFGVTATTVLGAMSTMVVSVIIPSLFPIILIPMIILYISTTLFGKQIDRGLTTMFAKGSTPLGEIDVPLWIRKKLIDSGDISKQISSVKGELRGQIRYHFRQNPALANQIVEEAIPCIKNSFGKNLEKELNKELT